MRSLVSSRWLRDLNVILLKQLGDRPVTNNSALHARTVLYRYPAITQRSFRMRLTDTIPVVLGTVCGFRPNSMLGPALCCATPHSLIDTAGPH